jgi:hypothetical protein
MTALLTRRAVAPVAFTLLLALAAIAFTGCTGDDNASAANGTADLQVLLAVQELGRANLHDIDDAINDDKKIPATARTTALRMATLVKLTPWPAELSAGANGVEAALKDLAKAVESNDMTAAGAAAKKAHDVEHDFSGKVWKYLHGKSGVTASLDDDH